MTESSNGWKSKGKKNASAFSARLVGTRRNAQLLRWFLISKLKVFQQHGSVVNQWKSQMSQKQELCVKWRISNGWKCGCCVLLTNVERKLNVFSSTRRLRAISVSVWRNNNMRLTNVFCLREETWGVLFVLSFPTNENVAAHFCYENFLQCSSFI